VIGQLKTLVVIAISAAYLGNADSVSRVHGRGRTAATGVRRAGTAQGTLPIAISPLSAAPRHLLSIIGCTQPPVGVCFGPEVGPAGSSPAGGWASPENSPVRRLALSRLNKAPPVC
jgi:hypothetical protein